MQKFSPNSLQKRVEENQTQCETFSFMICEIPFFLLPCGHNGTANTLRKKKKKKSIKKSIRTKCCWYYYDTTDDVGT